MATVNITTAIEVIIGNNPPIRMGSRVTPVTITLTDNIYSSQIFQDVSDTTPLLIFDTGVNVSQLSTTSLIALRPTQDMYISLDAEVLGTEGTSAMYIKANTWLLLGANTSHTGTGQDGSARIGAVASFSIIRSIYAKSVSTIGDVEVHVFS